MGANGGTSVGFINPTLYQAGASSFNSITSGNNKCTASTTCCSQGFTATAGWDPVTGWAVWIMLSLRASSRKSSIWLYKNNLCWAVFQCSSMIVDLYAFDAVVQGHHRLAGRMWEAS